MSQTRPRAGPRALFDRLMQCLMADDREQQLALNAEDCVWEFPFAAGDRPRRMEGLEAVRRAMTPWWEQARQAGPRISGFGPLAILLLLLSACTTMDPSPGEFEAPSPRLANLQRAALYP